MSKWDDAGIPYKGIFLGSLKMKNAEIEPIVIWQDEKVAVCESADLINLTDADVCGWRFFDVNANPEEILNALKGGNC